jgi:hypothetical protein
MTAQNEMLMLATKYQLEEGQYAHYYQNHRNWCVTKKGAHLIAKEAGIRMVVTHSDIGPCYIAYRGDFFIEDSLMASEVGSCRFDGSKNTPERTHAPEMAWKRLFVRGVLTCVAPGSGIYGDEEFSMEDTPPQQPAPTRQQQPQQQRQTSPPMPATPAPTNPDGTIDWANDPRIQQCQGAVGWKNYALKLPGEWASEMGKFCELTRLPRGDWERLLLDHCGKFNGDNGWWKPSSSEAYQAFADIVFTVDRNGKSKCGFALQIKKKLTEINEGIEVTGSFILQVPNNLGALDDFEVRAHSNEAAPVTDSGVTQATEGGYQAAPSFPDDVPF